MEQLYRYRKIILAIGLVIGLALALVAPGRAFETRSNDGEVIVAVDETIVDDLYVAGNTVTIEGTIQGDLIAIASMVTVKGTIEGDLIAAAQNVRIDGRVTDDVRIGAAALTLGQGARISDDLIATAYSLEIRPRTLVAGDILFVGSQALLAGEITGNVVTNVRGLTLRGPVSGDIRANVGTPQDNPAFSPLIFLPIVPSIPDVAGGLTLEEKAEVGGDIYYTSDASSEVPETAVAGEIMYQQRTPAPSREEIDEADIAGTWPWFLKRVRVLAASLLVGLLLVRLAPNLVQRSAAALQYKPLRSLTLGVVSFLGIFVAVLIVLTVMILLALLLGWVTLANLAWMVVALGLLIIFTLIVLFIFTAVYMAEIVVGYLGGRLILAYINPEWARHRYAAVILGVSIIVILTAIPYIGELIHLIVVLLGLGAFWVLEQETLPPHLTIT